MLLRLLLFSAGLLLATEGRNSTNTVSLFPFKGLKLTQILLAHIGATGALPNSDKILELSRQELWETGVLGDDMDIE